MRNRGGAAGRRPSGSGPAAPHGVDCCVTADRTTRASCCSTPETGDFITLGGPDTPDAVLASSLPYAPGRRHGDPGTRPLRLGFVNRRLAIVDLSAAGHGPMCDADATCWITYNGEIYNHVELRAELEGAGRPFPERHRHRGDARGVAARGGASCLGRLNGMFAFALWDARTPRAVLRPRPLRRQAVLLPVGRSQLRVRIRAAGAGPDPGASASAPRLEAVRDLLALDWVDHETSTFFEGVEQLPAGHSLTLAERRRSDRRWWSLDPARRAHGDPEEWTREFERLFTDAVRIRLRADVEVGSCLSGGIDSSAVVTTAARQIEPADPRVHLRLRRRTRLRRAAIREATCARRAAPSRTCRAATATTSGACSTAWRWRRTSPPPVPALYSQWQVMELAQRAGLKVLLDGQGGDETLAGYFRYLPMRLRDHLIDGKLGAFAALLGAVPRGSGSRPRSRSRSSRGCRRPWWRACAGTSARARTACSARRCAPVG